MRYKGRPKNAPLPDGYRPHDGTGRPAWITGEVMVQRRMGTLTLVNATKIESYAENAWAWADRREGPMDIIGFEDFVVVPHLGEAT